MQMRTSPRFRVMLQKELMQGMHDLEMPNYFEKDEVELEVTLRVCPDILSQDVGNSQTHGRLRWIARLDAS